MNETPDSQTTADRNNLQVSDNALRDTIAEIRADLRRGAYRAAADRAAGLPAGERGRFEVMLLRSRALQRLGSHKEAVAALQEFDLGAATAGAARVIALQRLSLRVFHEGILFLDAVLEDATRLFEVPDSEFSALENALAAQTYAIILSSGTIYKSEGGAAAEAARQRLPQVAQILEAAGLLQEAWGVRFFYADRAPVETVALLTHLGEAMEAAGRGEEAGETYIACAERLLTRNAPDAEIAHALARAAENFARTNHVYGAIEVRRVEAMRSIRREQSSTDALLTCLEEYAALPYPAKVLSTLLDLSQMAHERGDTQAARSYQERLELLSEETGSGLTADSQRMALIDLLMRNGNYGAAIGLCQEVLAKPIPKRIAALYAQLAGSAYSFVGDVGKAIEYNERAIRDFETVGDTDSASDAVTLLSQYRAGRNQPNDFVESENLLVIWAARDVERRDYEAAYTKEEVRVQILVTQFNRAKPNERDPQILKNAESAVDQAESYVKYLPTEMQFWYRGKNEQLHSQIYLVEGDLDNAVAAWERASGFYRQANRPLEVAGCCQMIGVVHLNRVNDDLRARSNIQKNFGIAESNLREALAFYEQMNMRMQSANLRFLLAQLYSNVARSGIVPAPVDQQMLDAALDHLNGADQEEDAMRREFAVGETVSELQRGKRGLIEQAQRFSALALQILCLIRPDANGAWAWSQRRRARSLTDVLGLRSSPPAHLMAQVAAVPAAVALLTQEQEIASRFAAADAPTQRSLRLEYQLLLQEMQTVPILQNLLELRQGLALTSEDLGDLFADINRPIVCVEWVAVDDLLFLLATTPGAGTTMHLLSLSTSQVQTWVAQNMAAEAGAFRDTLLTLPEILHEMDALIAPLAESAPPAALLILSPTAALHQLPLHALCLPGEKEPLLVRNPVVYCSSLGVLQQCRARRRALTASPTMALIGDPSGDRKGAAAFTAELAERFDTPALLGESVTRTAFTQAIAGRDILHFQGHAKHRPDQPLASHLLLAGKEKFTAEDIFALSDLQAELVTLAACESAANTISTGDEPDGLIPSFLVAGASTVLASLWRVEEDAAVRAMRGFYQRYLPGGADGERQPLDKVDALRQSVLTLRDTPGFEAPYYWAAFVLYGNWE